MTPASLTQMRQRLVLSQNEMAQRMGLARRYYQSLELGSAPIKARHVLLFERVALTRALELRDPALVPEVIREEARRLSEMLSP